jgi:flagellar export protein FliJ
MSWRQSLIRISTYEVETLQKRLAEVVGRRTDVELRLTMLEAEAAAEVDHARRDAEAAMGLHAFMAGVRRRRERFQQDIAEIGLEEAGARDALAEAFESMKKYEQVAEWARLAEAKEAGRREAAAFDELGLRSRA